MILKECPSRRFTSKREALAFLKANEQRIAQIKCSQVLKSMDKGGPRVTPFLLKTGDAVKGLDFVKDGYFYPVINTTKFLDSHLDVHLDNLWDRSIGQNQGKVYYVDTHSLKMTDVIAWPEDVKVFTKELDWSSLGRDYPGKTQALIFEIPKDKIDHDGARKVIDNKRQTENSIRMQYVKIHLAINDQDADFKENKAVWDQVYPQIANKETADELGYFWAVYEAKIMKEGSMVLSGSNEVTPIIYEKEEPGDATSSKGPAAGTPFHVSDAIQKLKFHL